MSFLLLSDVLQEYIYHIQVQNFSHRTIKGYRNNNLAFFRFIKTDYNITKVEEVKSQHIKAYFMYHKKIGRKATYINGILKNIRLFFKYCLDEGYITKNNNPVLKVDWLKEKRTVIHTFNDAEIGKMIQCFTPTSWIDMRNKMILMMFADTGIIASELIDIKEDDITIGQTYLILSNQMTKVSY